MDAGRVVGNTMLDQRGSFAQPVVAEPKFRAGRDGDNRALGQPLQVYREVKMSGSQFAQASEIARRNAVSRSFPTRSFGSGKTSCSVEFPESSARNGSSTAQVISR
jgi:hypothetical protein